MRKWLARTTLATLVAMAALIALLPVTAGADEGWSVTSFASDITIDSSGALQVVETIRADFGSPKHGIIRILRVRSSYDDEHDRLLDVSGVAAEQDGSAAQFTTDTSSDPTELQIKIGDPDRTISGVHTYRVSYTMKGALNAQSDHDELYLNATGDAWDVPIQHASATVHAPSGALGELACYQGAGGSHDTCPASSSGDTATYRATGQLDPGQQMTIVAALDKGAVPAPTPILTAKSGGGAGSFANPAAMPVAIAALLAGALVLLGLFLLATRGRRLPVLSPPAPGGPVTGPPDGLRPAQLAYARRGALGPLDVLATLVDLARRGYLTLQPLPSSRSSGRDDYLLCWKGTGADRPEPYEWELLTSVFAGQMSTSLEDVGTRWRSIRGRMSTQIAEDLQRRGLMAASARGVRRGFVIGGLLLIAVSMTGLFVALFSGWGPLGLVPFGLAGISILLGLLTPTRTPRGDELAGRVDAFTRYLNGAAPDPASSHMPSGEAMMALLPYAMVFGAIRRWLAAFPAQAVPTAIPGWRRPDGGDYEVDQFPATVFAFTAWQTAPVMTGGGGGSGWSGGSGFSDSGGVSGGGDSGGGGSSW